LIRYFRHKPRRKQKCEEGEIEGQYQFSVCHVDQNAKKEVLSTATLESSSPSQVRRNESTGDLREEGETIGKVEKRRKRRKKKTKKQEILEQEVTLPPSSKVKFSLLDTDKPISEEEEEIICLNARSTLVLPFTWKETTNIHKSVLEWVSHLRKRTIKDPTGKKIEMWTFKEKLPSEILDFTPQFRQVLGWKDRDKPPTGQTWTCQRLVMNSEAISMLFSCSKLVTIQSDTQVQYDTDMEAIELLVYPMGSAILAFNVNWLPQRLKEKLTLDDMRTVIFASKYIHKVKNLSLGWNFYDKSNKGATILEDVELSNEIMDARFKEEGTISLCSLGNWLLHLPGNVENNSFRFLDNSRHASHHSSIVLNKAPSSDSLQEYLFHLRHAFGQKNRPPPNPEFHLGEVLVPRMNRYVGISREGTICISWPIDSTDPKDFDFLKWHKKFQGVYLLLALHAHGERSVLYELSNLAASQADNLKLMASEISFNDMKVSRQKLRDLAALMVRYTLSMSSDDCGGSSEYSEFFTTIRKVFGIPELRAEISQELKDVLAVVETHYLEEERRQRDEAESARRQNREIQNTLRQIRDRQDQQFNLALSVIGSFTFPFVLISGIFGMNLDDLPIKVGFWPLIGVTFAVSILLFICLLASRIYFRKRDNLNVDLC